MITKDAGFKHAIVAIVSTYCMMLLCLVMVALSFEHAADDVV